MDYPMAQARRTIGFWPVSYDHILKFLKDPVKKEEIRHHNDARKEAAAEFLEKELKWTTTTNILCTKWSWEKQILWVELEEEHIVQDLYRRLAILSRDRIKLFKYVPFWAYQRNKAL